MFSNNRFLFKPLSCCLGFNTLLKGNREGVFKGSIHTNCTLHVFFYDTVSVVSVNVIMKFCDSAISYKQ